MSSPSSTKTPCSRRNFLRGVGTSLTLPWLESLPLRASETGKKATIGNSEQPPIRFGCVYFSNGVEPKHWWATGAGADMELGASLKPMQPFCDEMIFLKGLFNEQAVKNKSPHLGRMPNFLSGAWVSLDQNDIRVGKTMDQEMSQRIGSRTDIPSLVMGIEPTELRLEDGLSMIYGSCISWASETKPATKEIYPARVYDRLLGNGKSRETDRSILDRVLQDALDLRPKLAKGDRSKLDEYLESIRDIEKRIDVAGREQRLEGSKPNGSNVEFVRPDDKLPQDVPFHMKLMLDLIVLAFRMDKTRIATCMLNNDLSQMNFGFLEGVQGSLHLDLTHNGRDPKLEEMYLRTNQFHMQQFAYLVGRLKEIQEGEGTLLDHSILLGGSNLFDGDKHQADEMPLVLAGSGGGKLQTGRIINLMDQPAEHRRACGLYLTLMNHMGIGLKRFGDSNRMLPELLS